MENGNDEARFIIEGDPGENNTFIHVGKAINVNTKATTVENNFYFSSDGEMKETALKEVGIPTAGKPEKKPLGKKLGEMTLREMLKQDLIDTTPIQKEIMNYVSSIRTKVKNNMDKTYMCLWGTILEHDTFKIDLYDPGKQECKFNRNLVANIMHYLDDKGFYEENYNSSEMTRVVEGDADNPVRKAFRKYPDKKYCDAVDAILEAINTD